MTVPVEFVKLQACFRGYNWQSLRAQMHQRHVSASKINALGIILCRLARVGQGHAKSENVKCPTVWNAHKRMRCIEQCHKSMLHLQMNRRILLAPCALVNKSSSLLLPVLKLERPNRHTWSALSFILDMSEFLQDFPHKKCSSVLFDRQVPAILHDCGAPSPYSDQLVSGTLHGPILP
jgi:hypothetical protein